MSSDLAMHEVVHHAMTNRERALRLFEAVTDRKVLHEPRLDGTNDAHDRMRRHEYLLRKYPVRPDWPRERQPPPLPATVRALITRDTRSLL